jgi:hypothetical protein
MPSTWFLVGRSKENGVGAIVTAKLLSHVREAKDE